MQLPKFDFSSRGRTMTRRVPDVDCWENTTPSLWFTYSVTINKRRLQWAFWLISQVASKCSMLNTTLDTNCNQPTPLFWWIPPSFHNKWTHSWLQIPVPVTIDNLLAYNSSTWEGSSVLLRIKNMPSKLRLKRFEGYFDKKIPLKLRKLDIQWRYNIWGIPKFRTCRLVSENEEQ